MVPFTISVPVQWPLDPGPASSAIDGIETPPVKLSRSAKPETVPLQPTIVDVHVPATLNPFCAIVTVIGTPSNARDTIVPVHVPATFSGVGPTGPPPHA